MYNNTQSIAICSIVYLYVHLNLIIVTNCKKNSRLCNYSRAAKINYEIERVIGTIDMKSLLAEIYDRRFTPDLIHASMYV